MELTAMKRFFAWGPIVVLLAVEYTTTVTIYCLITFWPPFYSPVCVLNFLLMVVIHIFGFYNFLCASLVGPGLLPLNWKPDNPNDEQFLIYCKVCKGFKAPRAHHCRRCKRCVLKMDHHCPWMNNCCGHRNHAYLIYFCLSLVFGCGHYSPILVLSMLQIYVSAGKTFNLPLIFYVYDVAACISIGVFIGAWILILVQLYSILRNRTLFERILMSKVKDKNFIYPYDLGFIKNLKLVFCGKRVYNDDDAGPNHGILWEVKEGCDQYTLTAEAVRQSEEKKRAMKDYVVVKNFSGSFFPTTMGFGVMCCIPFSIWPRAPVNVGERVLVARVKRYWLYGEVQANNTNSDAILAKGWFPACCAEEILKSNDESKHEINSSTSKKDD